MPAPGFLARRSKALAVLAALALLPAADLAREPGREAERGPEGAEEWFLLQRMAPDGVVHVERRREAIEAARSLRLRAMNSPEAAFSQLDWELLGPVNIGGRITDIAAAGVAPNLVYAAAASGGVWKTTDNGVSWAPVFDGNGELAIGALAVDPGDPDLLYVGTGEANPGGGSLAYGGNGVWKTLDGGASWSHLGLDSTGSIGRIAVDPTNPQRVFVAAMGSLFSPNPRRGLYRSTDGGANWTRVLFVNDSTGCVDVAVDPSDPQRVFAATWERTRRAHSRDYAGPASGIYRSTDGGDTWTRLAGGLPAPATAVGRIGIAIAPSEPQTLYASVTLASSSLGFYRSTNGGNTWTLTANDPLEFDSSFPWWFGRVWVNPADRLDVWVSGLGLYRSTDGGDNWGEEGFDLHVDHHAMWIHPANPQVMWEGNDGGLYYTDDGGGEWRHTESLPITQHYTIEVHPAEPLVTYTGNQDNGTVRTPTGAAGDWEWVFGGDGQYVNVDPGNTQVIYAEYQYGAFVRSVDGGASFASATTGIAGGDRKNWTTPVVVDPSGPGYPNTRLYFGTQRVYRTTDAAGSWSAVSPDLTNGNGGSGGVVFGTITTIAVAPSDSATIYAGTDDGNLWVTSNYGASWQPADTGLPQRWVTRVVVDPADAAVAYVTFSGLRWNEALPHVFRTTNRGATWTDISGDLPDVPVNDLAVDPRNSSFLYVATDIGVFATASTGGTWEPLGGGMPEGAIVNDLKLIGGQSPALYAATYGRSAWRVDLSGKLVTVEPREDPALRIAALRPNPWRGSVAVEFTLPAAQSARLQVVDVFGRRVATLARGPHRAGRHEVRWDGRDRSGQAAPPGVYFFRLDAGNQSTSLRATRIH